MQTYLDINNIFFTVLDYPMSYIEFFGTLLNIASVWLVARNKILNWPIGILGVILFGMLYWQIQLYSDFLEQIYFFFTGFWGWWVWSQGKRGGEKAVRISFLKNNVRIIYGVVIIVGTIILGYLVSNLHIYFPAYFPLPASFAYLDAFTTVLTFAATILMIRKKVECWYIWILVDIIGIWLYWVKGVHLISLLYGLFLIMASQGLYIWQKKFKNNLD
jgi:nicotinamide mononucleotide transporter